MQLLQAVAIFIQNLRLKCDVEHKSIKSENQNMNRQIQWLEPK